MVAFNILTKIGWPTLSRSFEIVFLELTMSVNFPEKYKPNEAIIVLIDLLPLNKNDSQFLFDNLSE